MPTLVTDTGLTVATFPTQAVEMIAYLDAPGGWVAVPHLYCDRLMMAVNAIDEATLSYQIGAGVIQPGASSFANYQPLDIQGKFVRITITTTPANIVWVGYVVSEEVEREGVIDDSGTNKLVGQQQTIHAVGLEYFLARKQIDSALVRRDSSSSDSVRVLRPLVFNGGPTGTLDATSGTRGNRSSDLNADGEYDFAENHADAELWRADDIITHLLEYHTPVNSVGDPAPCPFILNLADDASALLEGFYPTFATENKTVYDCLNELARPQRGLVWWNEFVTSPETRVEIRVQSLATSTVSLPGGGTLPANTNQETLDFDGELDVAEVQLKHLGSRDYDQVVARGARMTSTFTVGMPDDTLVIDWSTSGGPNDVGTEVGYKAGASTDPDYAGLPTKDKEKRNDAVRLSDEFKRVYQAYRIPATWDSKSGDGSGAIRNWAFPVLSTDGSVTGGLGVQPQGIRLLNQLRLKDGWDYSNPFDPKPATPTVSQAELAPPFAFVKVATSPDRWQDVEKLDKSDFAAGTPVTAGIETTFDVVMQQGVPGILLVVHNGMPHALAFGHFDNAAPTEHPPEVDYETLRSTLCAEADAFCEGTWPTTGLPTNKPLNVLVIDAGEHYRLDFLPANTVVGIRRGVPYTCGNTGAVLRDDRKYLSDVARLAYEWYRLDRQSLSVTFRQVRPLFELGMLITAIGEGSTAEDVNTVVSQITYDLVDGTMHIDTHDDTLDVRVLV